MARKKNRQAVRPPDGEVGVSGTANWSGADRKRWCARAYSNGRHTHLGHFDSEEDASRAYQDFINNTGGNK